MNTGQLNSKTTPRVVEPFNFKTGFQMVKTCSDKPVWFANGSLNNRTGNWTLFFQTSLNYVLVNRIGNRMAYSGDPKTGKFQNYWTFSVLVFEWAGNQLPGPNN
jgi:hypothetical protein